MNCPTPGRNSYSHRCSGPCRGGRDWTTGRSSTGARGSHVEVPHRVAWRDVPERYGSWTTLHTRFRRWAAGGIE
ncbi:transposase [Streptomyces sp. NPDC003016]